MKKLILFALFLLASSKAFAGYPTYTLCPSGCDFATLQGVVTDMSTNHAVLDSPVTVTISGNWSSAADTTAVSFTGITTTGTNKITVTAPSTSGVYSTAGHYRLEVTNSTGINIAIGNVILKNLQVKVTDTSNFHRGITLNTGSGTSDIISGCIIVMNSSSGTNNAGIFLDSSASGTVENCVIYQIGSTDATQYGIWNFIGSSSFTVYNTTVIGFVKNFAADDPMSAKNCIAQNGSTADYNGTFNTHSNNISKDATSPDTSFRNITLSFVNSASRNYGLAVSDTGAIGQGADLSATFTTDITGATRSVPWDIGAFKYAAISMPETVTFGGTVKTGGNTSL